MVIWTKLYCTNQTTPDQTALLTSTFMVCKCRMVEYESTIIWTKMHWYKPDQTALIKSTFMVCECRMIEYESMVIWTKMHWYKPDQSRSNRIINVHFHGVWMQKCDLLRLTHGINVQIPFWTWLWWRKSIFATNSKLKNTFAFDSNKLQKTSQTLMRILSTWAITVVSNSLQSQSKYLWFVLAMSTVSIIVLVISMICVPQSRACWPGPRCTAPVRWEA